ncbi:MAG: CPBP family glutamic-type intramembrane protease [Candidatus Micrarchaeia archaeon]|jgi:membrane protease YdiL (CAAX protease family)
MDSLAFLRSPVLAVVFFLPSFVVFLNKYFGLFYGKLALSKLPPFAKVFWNFVNFRVGDLKKTILFAGILGVSLDVGVAWFFGKPLWFDGDKVAAFFVSVLFAPFEEELLFRAGFIGLLFVVLSEACRPFKQTLGTKTLVVLAIFSALYFGVVHPNNNAFELALRASSGLLYAGLYLLSGKNLVPPVAAHAAGNLAVILLGT